MTADIGHHRDFPDARAVDGIFQKRGIVVFHGQDQIRIAGFQGSPQVLELLAQNIHRDLRIVTDKSLDGNKKGGGCPFQKSDPQESGHAGLHLVGSRDGFCQGLVDGFQPFLKQLAGRRQFHTAASPQK